MRVTQQDSAGFEATFERTKRKTMKNKEKDKKRTNKKKYIYILYIICTKSSTEQKERAEWS